VRVPGIPYVQGRNDYDDGDNVKYGLAFHNTSNDASDTEEASYATRRTDGISAHIYADNNSATQSIDTNDKTGHAGSAQGNENAISFELTGANGWTRAQWLANIEWNLLGRVCAAIIRHHWPDGSFQVRRASVAEMKANPKIKALYGHDDMRRAWGGTTHTDPGPSFPWDHLIAVIKTALGTGPTVTEENDMQQWFARPYASDPRPGKVWFGDYKSRRLEPEGFIQVMREVAVREKRGGLHVDAAGEPIVRGNPDGMGPEETGIDYDRLATAIVDKLPVGTITPPTAAQIAEAVADEQRDRMQD
jgi:hypothetical protein